MKNIKKQISEEFENILRMLNFSEDGHDIFRRWYVDGKIYHHLVVDPSNEKSRNNGNQTRNQTS